MDEVTLPQAAEPAALWEHPCYVSCRLPSLIARATVGVGAQTAAGEKAWWLLEWEA